MDDVVILQTARLLLQAYFNFMKMANKTEEEVSELHEVEKEKFFQNDPGNLPDPE